MNSALLKVAAQKLGLDQIDESACVVDSFGSWSCGKAWRVRVVGNGEPLLCNPDAVPDEAGTYREVEVTEREMREVES